MLCKGKKVFITGASSGIGLACAQYFAREGADLLLCARSKDRLDNLATELSAFDITVDTMVCDVSDKDAVSEAFSNLSNRWEFIDILINNAGLALGLDKFADGDVADWENMIDVNIKGVLYITKHVLQGMLQQNSGYIINVGSLAGYQVYAGGTVYCATKFALRALSEGLKLDCHGTKIRVTSINPGLVDTNFSLVRFKGDSTRADQVYAGLTALTAEDIADIILYCATRPPHVDIHEMIITPTDQSSSTMCHREF